MNTLFVNLNTIMNNYLKAQSLTKADIAAVVKSNCYGLGLETIAPFLEKIGCNKFFVADLEEGIRLRKLIDRKASIFVLQGTPFRTPMQFVEHNLIPVINSVNELVVWNKTGNLLNRKLPSILHVDTGMGRMGLSSTQFKEVCDNPSTISHSNIMYVLSHLAYADDPNHPYHAIQLSAFKKLQKLMPNTKYSLAASGGLYLGEKYHFDLVRLGACLFGVNPTTTKGNPVLNPISLQTKILHISHLDHSTYIGYECTYKAKKGQVIATLPIGYAHGYLKKFSNIAHASIQGQLVPIIGQVSMEMTTIDITSIPPHLQKIGQKVELIGQHYPLEILCKESGVSDAEIMLSLSNLERKYLNAA